MSQTTPPTQHVSPDGLWRWDGTQWVANTPPAARAWSRKKIGAAVGASLLAATAIPAIAASGRTDPALCLPVSMAKLENIATGSSVRMHPKRGAAYKSPDFVNADVYLIAMTFTMATAGGGSRDEYGVWLSTSLTPDAGMIMAVESAAKTYTDWPDSYTTRLAVSSIDPSVKAAKGCLALS